MSIESNSIESNNDKKKNIYDFVDMNNVRILLINYPDLLVLLEILLIHINKITCVN